MAKLLLLTLLTLAVDGIEISLRRKVILGREKLHGASVTNAINAPHRYVGVVSIGTPGQDFNVALDTDTAALWVPDVGCKCSEECDNAICYQICAKHCCNKTLAAPTSGMLFSTCTYKNAFDGSRSVTFIKSRQVDVNISYDGETVNAAFGYDTFRFGPHYKPGLTANSLKFALVREFTEKYEDAAYDGVLGLARRDASTGVDSVVMQMIKSGVLPDSLLTIWLQAPRRGQLVDGALTLGYVDKEHCFVDTVPDYVPVTTTDHFSFRIISANTTKEGFNATNWQGVIDLMDTFLTVPEAVWSGLQSATSAKLDITSGHLIAECSESAGLEIVVGKEMLFLPSKHLLTPFSGDSCLLRVKRADANAPLQWRLGTPFLFSHCVVFDYNGYIAFPLHSDVY